MIFHEYKDYFLFERINSSNDPFYIELVVVYDKDWKPLIELHNTAIIPWPNSKNLFIKNVVIIQAPDENKKIKYGLLNAQGIMLAPPEYDWLRGNPEDEKLKFIKNNEMGYIDFNGKEVSM